VKTVKTDCKMLVGNMIDWESYTRSIHAMHVQMHMAIVRGYVFD
jgi:hypothetical protein